MQEISRFLGIVIAILGEFPKRALNLVLEWYQLHRDELRQDWELAKARKPLRQIRPLE